MSRLIAFILGGAALALYAPVLFLPANSDVLKEVTKFWMNLLGADWFAKVFTLGPGVFAGLALILFAIRGKD